MADHQKEEVRSELHTLLQNKQISKEAFDHAESALSQEWGPHKGNVEPAKGSADELFNSLDGNLRQLCTSNNLSQGALGAIYMVISQERAGKPVVGVPVNNPEVQEKHRSLFGGHSSGKAGGQHHTININAARLGQIVIDSTARGFGFTLGGDAANSLVHGLFN